MFVSLFVCLSVCVTCKWYSANYYSRFERFCIRVNYCPPVYPSACLFFWVYNCLTVYMSVCLYNLNLVLFQVLPECGMLTLQHHMLEPIQRIPRYQLLLKGRDSIVSGFIFSSMSAFLLVNFFPAQRYICRDSIVSGFIFQFFVSFFTS